MNIPNLLELKGVNTNIQQIQRLHLIWMLLLRVFLHTGVLALSFIFQGARFEVYIMPRNLLILLLLIVYTTTIISSFFLLNSHKSLHRFGLIQNLLDTVFAALLVYATGASKSIFSSVFFFPIISGGLILRQRGGLVSAAAATLLYGCLLFAEASNAIPGFLIDQGFKPSSIPVILNQFAASGLTFFLAAILSVLFGLRLTNTENALTDSVKNYNQLADLYKQIFDNISTGIITINQDNQITSANNAAEAITGTAIEDITGKELGEIFPCLDTMTRGLRRTADFIRQDGKEIRLGYSVMFLHKPAATDSSPKYEGLIITLQDVSAVEQLEKQIHQSEKLAAIGMMSAGIAHDFRNPLTAISGSAQVLADEFSKEAHPNQLNIELTQIIVREANRMIGTIAEFLRFSRPESAKGEWFSLQICISEVLQVCMADPSWPKTAKIILDIPKALDIWADQKQIHAVILHLVTNAMAFCPSGQEKIIIKAEELRQKDEQDTVRISIHDNGPGVEAKNLEKIWEPFFTSRADGTGLGLAIIKQIIEEHKGTIDVSRSNLGGAKFSFSLPLPS